MEFEAMLSELNSLTALGRLAKYGQSLGRNTNIPPVPLTCEEPICRLWPTLCEQVSDYRRMPAYSKSYPPERHRIGRTGWLRAGVGCQRWHSFDG